MTPACVWLYTITLLFITSRHQRPPSSLHTGFILSQNLHEVLILRTCSNAFHPGSHSFLGHSLIHQLSFEQEPLLAFFRFHLGLKSLLFVQQAPDYRLYKSEPELTTVKEEVDEANNGEDRDKTESSADNKDAVASKGSVAASSEQRRQQKIIPD